MVLIKKVFDANRCFYAYAMNYALIFVQLPRTVSWKSKEEFTQMQEKDLLSDDFEYIHFGEEILIAPKGYTQAVSLLDVFVMDFNYFVFIIRFSCALIPKIDIVQLIVSIYPVVNRKRP